MNGKKAKALRVQARAERAGNWAHWQPVLDNTKKLAMGTVQMDHNCAKKHYRNLKRAAR